MKLTELIAEAQKVLDEHGDLDVCIYTACNSCDIAIEEKSYELYFNQDWNRVQIS